MGPRFEVFVEALQQKERAHPGGFSRADPGSTGGALECDAEGEVRNGADVSH